MPKQNIDDAQEIEEGKILAYFDCHVEASRYPITWEDPIEHYVMNGVPKEVVIFVELKEITLKDGDELKEAFNEAMFFLQIPQTPSD